LKNETGFNALFQCSLLHNCSETKMMNFYEDMASWLLTPI